MASTDLTWLAPLPESSYQEPQDGHFLQAAGLESLEPSLRDFWPRGGPVWDGVAKVAFAGSATGVLLLEAKNYPAEMRTACKATGRSLARITNAIETTRADLRAGGTLETWMTSYYQLANRLAWLRWLQRADVQAWLVLLGITDDRRHRATTAAERRAGMSDVESEIGLVLGDVPKVVEMLLPAKDDPRHALPPH